jgi:hypothetical protein
MSDPIMVNACTERDITRLYHCQGCFEQFPTAVLLEGHEPGCHAYRNHVVQTKLDAQARDDGREPDMEDAL